MPIIVLCICQPISCLNQCIKVLFKTPSMLIVISEILFMISALLSLPLLLFRILCLSSFFPLLNSSSSSPLKRKSPTRQRSNYSIASCYFQSLATILVRTRSNFIKLAPCRKYIPQTLCALRACASQHKGQMGSLAV